MSAQINFKKGSVEMLLLHVLSCKGDHGYISDYKQQAGKRLVRVYYHLEDAGWQRLEDLKREYFATYHSIQQVLNNDFAEDDANE